MVPVTQRTPQATTPANAEWDKMIPLGASQTNQLPQNQNPLFKGSGLTDTGNPLIGAVQGFGKGVYQTAAGIDQLLHKVGINLPDTESDKVAKKQLAAGLLDAQGKGQGTGKFLEGLTEFLTGSEATGAGKIASLLPRAAAMGGIGATQAAAKSGGDVPETIIGGLTGTAGELLLSPIVKQVLKLAGIGIPPQVPKGTFDDFRPNQGPPIKYNPKPPEPGPLAPIPPIKPMLRNTTISQSSGYDIANKMFGGDKQAGVTIDKTPFFQSDGDIPPAFRVENATPEETQAMVQNYGQTRGGQFTQTPNLSENAQSLLDTLKKLEPDTWVPVSPARISKALPDMSSQDVTKAFQELQQQRLVRGSISDQSHMPQASIHQPYGTPEGGIDTGVPNADNPQLTNKLAGLAHIEPPAKSLEEISGGKVALGAAGNLLLSAGLMHHAITGGTHEAAIGAIPLAIQGMKYLGIGSGAITRMMAKPATRALLTNMMKGGPLGMSDSAAAHLIKDALVGTTVQVVGPNGVKVDRTVGEDGSLQ